MDHAEYHVQLLNEQGFILGGKRRADIDTARDRVRVVHMVLFTPEKKILLAKIPDTASVFPGLLGTTAATIVRVGERRHQAALRVLQKELGVTTVAPHLLEEQWDRYPDLAPRRTATFVGLVVAVPTQLNPADCAGLKIFSRQELLQALAQPERFAASFLHIWERYQSQLPF